MLPTATLTSMLEEPSRGSNSSRYRPRGNPDGIGYGSGISSDTSPASCPPHSFVRTKISFASTSSFFCASPCTLSEPASPSASISAPFPMSVEMRLHARRTSFTSAVNPVPPGLLRRCSSMRKRVSVVVPKPVADCVMRRSRGRWRRTPGWPGCRRLRG